MFRRSLATAVVLVIVAGAAHAGDNGLRIDNNFGCSQIRQLPDGRQVPYATVSAQVADWHSLLDRSAVMEALNKARDPALVCIQELTSELRETYVFFVQIHPGGYTSVADPNHTIIEAVWSLTTREWKITKDVTQDMVKEEERLAAEKRAKEEKLRIEASNAEAAAREQKQAETAARAQCNSEPDISGPWFFGGNFNVYARSFAKNNYNFNRSDFLCINSVTYQSETKEGGPLGVFHHAKVRVEGIVCGLTDGYRRDFRSCHSGYGDDGWYVDYQ